MMYRCSVFRCLIPALHSPVTHCFYQLFNRQQMLVGLSNLSQHVLTDAMFRKLRSHIPSQFSLECGESMWITGAKRDSSLKSPCNKQTSIAVPPLGWAVDFSFFKYTNHSLSLLIFNSKLYYKNITWKLKKSTSHSEVKERINKITFTSKLFRHFTQRHRHSFKWETVSGGLEISFKSEHVQMQKKWFQVQHLSAISYKK